MKKFFLLLPLIMVVTSLTTFARITGNSDPRIEQEFKRQFAGAANVVWSKIQGGFHSASFIWADRQTIAYFNSDAELLGCIRGLFFNQLPLTVMRSVEEKFKNSIILEIREITNAEGVNYTLNMEYKNKKYKIRMSSNGEILETQKLKK